MSASDHLSVKQFGKYSLTHSSYDVYGDKTTYSHKIEAHHMGKKVGHMEWVGGVNSRTPNELSHIEVDPKHRRKGLATAMYNFGKSKDPHLAHAGERTKEGDSWSSSLPDYTSPHTVLD